MAGVNKQILLGNLGTDVETRTLDNGKMVANFSMATSESYKDKQGNKVDKTEWHRVVLWSPLAEIAEKYLSKGNQVYIEGKTTHRSYDSNGETKYITEVIGNNMTLVGGKAQEPAGNEENNAQEPVAMDNLPF